MKTICIGVLWFFCATGTAFAVDGEIDASFGVDGVAWAGISDGDGRPSGCRPIVQPDGKIVICGSRMANGATGADFVVARFNGNGTLDDSFGLGGLMTIDFDNGAGGDQASGIAFQSDGRIVVAGTTHGVGSQSANFAVARLNTDGTLDTTFGDGTGKATMGFDLDAAGAGNDTVYTIAIQPDDKILLAGSAETANGTDVAVARLLADGSRDPSFNLTGEVTFGFNVAGASAEADYANGVAVDDQGRIVLAGTANVSEPEAQAEFGAARLLPDGQFDPGFNGNGHTTVAFDPGTGLSTAFAFGVVILRDGSIVIPGYANSSVLAENMDMAATRLLADGSPDPTFGIDGKILIPFDLESDGVDVATAAVEQADGRLVLVGTALGNNSQYAIAARVMRDGSSDATFGTLGKETYDLGVTVPSTQAFTGTTFQGTQIIAGGVAYVPPLGMPQPLDCFAARLINDSIFANGLE